MLSVYPPLRNPAATLDNQINETFVKQRHGIITEVVLLEVRKNKKVVVKCPKCQFGSYGAYFVYGKACYRYALTQKPWLDKKLFNYELKLREEITISNHTH